MCWMERPISTNTPQEKFFYSEPNLGVGHKIRAIKHSDNDRADANFLIGGDWRSGPCI